MKALHRSPLSAFTLLEIMLVVMIIALLAGLAIFNMGKTLNTAGAAAASAHLNSFDVALLNYRAKAGAYPTTDQGLKALIVRPTTEPIPKGWSPILKSIPLDPWKNDYLYVCPGKHNPDGYDVYSAGEDKIPGTDDDIGNWEDKKQ